MYAKVRKNVSGFVPSFCPYGDDEPIEDVSTILDKRLKIRPVLDIYIYIYLRANNKCPQISLFDCEFKVQKACKRVRMISKSM